jgi:uncharacterized membrane protein (UPF0127 family)
MGLKYIVNLTRESIICDRAMVAERPLQRMRGLLGRSSLAAGEGLLLTPAPSIHTAFMRFPIDVVFLNNQLHVLRLVERLAPWRAAWTRRARAVLELSAGAASGCGIQVGDVIAVLDERDHVEAVADEPTALDYEAAQNGRQPSPPAVRAPRALLITPDHRFRAVASAFLGQHGCSVTSGARITEAARWARLAAADVVILDASISLTAAVREAARVQALEPPVGIVMVAEGAAYELTAMLVLAKWNSFDGLYSAIEAELARLRRSSV